MIRRSDDVVCDPHHTSGGDGKRGFSGLASTDGDGLSVIGLQNHCDDFLVWASKLRSMVW
jgi:hypothetical protein